MGTSENTRDHQGLGRTAGGGAPSAAPSPGAASSSDNHDIGGGARGTASSSSPLGKIAVCNQQPQAETRSYTAVHITRQSNHPELSNPFKMGYDGKQHCHRNAVCDTYDEWISSDGSAATARNAAQRSNINLMSFINT